MIPGKPCACGCGQHTSDAKFSCFVRTYIHDHNVRVLTDNERYTVLENGCWSWKGSVNPKTGYGTYRTRTPNRKTLNAHKWFYEKYKGSIPAGLILDHKCRNRRCVNPEHLEPVTDAVNVYRGNCATLNSESVAEIRKLYALGGVRQKDLAELYGVAICTVSSVVRRESWREVE